MRRVLFACLLALALAIWLMQTRGRAAYSNWQASKASLASPEARTERCMTHCEFQCAEATREDPPALPRLDQLEESTLNEWWEASQNLSLSRNWLLAEGIQSKSSVQGALCFLLAKSNGCSNEDLSKCLTLVQDDRRIGLLLALLIDAAWIQSPDSWDMLLRLEELFDDVRISKLRSNWYERGSHAGTRELQSLWSIFLQRVAITGDVALVVETIMETGDLSERRLHLLEVCCSQRNEARAKIGPLVASLNTPASIEVALLELWHGRLLELRDLPWLSSIVEFSDSDDVRAKGYFVLRTIDRGAAYRAIAKAIERASGSNLSHLRSVIRGSGVLGQLEADLGPEELRELNERLAR